MNLDHKVFFTLSNFLEVQCRESGKESPSNPQPPASGFQAVCAAKPSSMTVYPSNAFAFSGARLRFDSRLEKSCGVDKKAKIFFTLSNFLEVAGVEPASQYAKHKRLQI